MVNMLLCAIGKGRLHHSQQLVCSFYLRLCIYGRFGFIICLWVRHAYQTGLDLEWLKAGGFSSVLPQRNLMQARKSFLQAVMIGGLSVNMSGIALMFPFLTTMFTDTPLTKYIGVLICQQI